MNSRTFVRSIATATAAAGLLAGLAGTANASSFYLAVGAERCISTFANQVQVLGTANPYPARFQVSRNGVVLYQGTAAAFTAQYTGYGRYEFCGKNKLGNPGPITVNLTISQ